MATTYSLSRENLTFYYTNKSGIEQRMGGQNDIETALTTTPLLPMYNTEGGYYTQDSVPDGQQLPTMRPDMDHAWLTSTSNVLGSTLLKGYPADDWSLLSFFGRINYSYKERYMATVIMRADGSSNFARGNRWGYFPSVSAGWVVSDEPFMQATHSWLDQLKIRGSW